MKELPPRVGRPGAESWFMFPCNQKAAGTLLWLDVAVHHSLWDGTSSSNQHSQSGRARLYCLEHILETPGQVALDAVNSAKLSALHKTKCRPSSRGQCRDFCDRLAVWVNKIGGK